MNHTMNENVTITADLGGYEVDSAFVAAEMLAKARLVALGRRHLEPKLVSAPIARALHIAALEARPETVEPRAADSRVQSAA
jgi:hypothetical protein